MLVLSAFIKDNYFFSCVLELVGSWCVFLGISCDSVFAFTSVTFSIYWKCEDISAGGQGAADSTLSLKLHIIKDQQTEASGGFNRDQVLQYLHCWILSYLVFCVWFKRRLDETVQLSLCLSLFTGFSELFNELNEFIKCSGCFCPQLRAHWLSSRLSWIPEGLRSEVWMWIGLLYFSAFTSNLS